MTAWAALAVAIVCEVASTLSLRVAVNGRRAFYAVVVAGYLAAFVLLSVALAHDMPLGVAYGVWTATGVAATAVLSAAIFDEPLTVVMVAGIALIAGGVLLVELGAP